ncbi:hypothetical protein PIB30_115768, partial [Stylosanthes scabra]|nr:hypothetical protein [Stylosanthes scabra]
MKLLSFKQDNLSVSDYTRKFEELCRFSSVCQMAPNEEWKCMKYEEGLREEIANT